ncbi:MAG: histidine kinase dimerization/phosphoacceptor domain -containing protein [Gracilimonas sp.]|nr:histidine kinase dimerization/phosphoacceptor domain -containing protein [Gracilimonas sp.]
MLVSLTLGFFIVVLVLILWINNQREINESQRQKIEDTAQLITSQFQRTVQESIHRLENLRNRIEVTNGDYFEFWRFDGNQIVEQDASFMLIEWIDSAMVIQRVLPEAENEEALGLDISELDYRRDDWLQTKKDSIVNFTNWLKLVQGQNAFLVDAPLFYGGAFQGTMTAGLDFTSPFNDIMEGLDQYNVEISDEEGTVFYRSGDTRSARGSAEEKISRSILLEGTNSGNWTVMVYPNMLFSAENSFLPSYLNLALALLLGVLVSVLFYFMQTAFLAQKKEIQANEKIRALIESAPVAIYAIDTDGIIRDFWNKAAERILGWKQEEVLGKFMPHVRGKWASHFKILMKQTLEEGDIRNKEITRSKKDGTPVHLRLNVGRIVKDRANNPLMLAILEDITKEKEYQEQLENSVKEKEVLLSEIHHRVKNNLAIIAGLIELQKSGVDDDSTSIILNETQNRIYSISEVHELLYNTDSFTDITFEQYAIKLIERIQRMYRSDDKKVDINYDFEPIKININQAIPLGLLLNELVTNSFKHAFAGKEKGSIYVSLQKEEDKIKVVYRDSGVGFDKKIFTESKTLGITLIKTLISQLEADYTLSSANGFSFTFYFKLHGSSGKRGSYSNLVTE